MEIKIRCWPNIRFGGYHLIGQLFLLIAKKVVSLQFEYFDLTN